MKKRNVIGMRRIVMCVSSELKVSEKSTKNSGFGGGLKFGLRTLTPYFSKAVINGIIVEMLSQILLANPKTRDTT